jgi:hypothetical protein
MLARRVAVRTYQRLGRVPPMAPELSRISRSSLTALAARNMLAKPIPAAKSGHTAAISLPRARTWEMLIIGAPSCAAEVWPVS